MTTRISRTGKRLGLGIDFDLRGSNEAVSGFQVDVSLLITLSAIENTPSFELIWR